MFFLYLITWSKLSRYLGFHNLYLGHIIDDNGYNHTVQYSLNRLNSIVKRNHIELNEENIFYIDELSDVGCAKYIKQNLSKSVKCLNQNRSNDFVESVVNNRINETKENIESSLLDIMNATDYYINTNKSKL